MKRRVSEWLKLFHDPEAELEADEMVARESYFAAVYMHQVLALLGGDPTVERADRTDHGVVGQLARLDHLLQRIWGAEERDEIWKLRISRADPSQPPPPYPIAQLDAPEYLGYLRVVEAYEARRQLALKNGDAQAAIAAANEVFKD